MTDGHRRLLNALSCNFHYHLEFKNFMSNILCSKTLHQYLDEFALEPAGDGCWCNERWKNLCLLSFVLILYSRRLIEHMHHTCLNPGGQNVRVKLKHVTNDSRNADDLTVPLNYLPFCQHVSDKLSLLSVVERETPCMLYAYFVVWFIICERWHVQP
jgi:hypothetical protein